MDNEPQLYFELGPGAYIDVRLENIENCSYVTFVCIAYLLLHIMMYQEEILIKL